MGNKREEIVKERDGLDKKIDGVDSRYTPFSRVKERDGLDKKIDGVDRRYTPFSREKVGLAIGERLSDRFLTVLSSVAKYKNERASREMWVDSGQVERSVGKRIDG
jgi:hypothetical protein